MYKPEAFIIRVFITTPESELAFARIDTIKKALMRSNI